MSEKRFIEETFPVKEVGIQSAKGKDHPPWAYINLAHLVVEVAFKFISGNDICGVDPSF